VPHDRDAAPQAPAPLSAPVFQILLALVDDDLHGYAIIQDIAARTGGEVRLTASTLYAAVKRLLDAGWIEELTERPRVERDDPRRRYYRITRLGRDVARAEARRVERLAAMARAKRLLPPLRPSSAPKGS
jgi:DNA-binding PadR family transcriptional regulator